MQTAQCSSLASSQMRPRASRKSLESSCPSIILLPVLVFVFVFLLQGILQEGGTQTSGVSRISFINAFRNFGEVSGQVFCSGNSELDAFGIIAQLPYTFSKLLKAKHNLEALPPWGFLCACGLGHTACSTYGVLLWSGISTRSVSGYLSFPSDISELTLKQ